MTAGHARRRYRLSVLCRQPTRAVAFLRTLHTPASAKGPLAYARHATPRHKHLSFYLPHYRGSGEGDARAPVRNGGDDMGIPRILSAFRHLGGRAEGTDIWARRMAARPVPPAFTLRIAAGMTTAKRSQRLPMAGRRRQLSTTAIQWRSYTKLCASGGGALSSNGHGLSREETPSSCPLQAAEHSCRQPPSLYCPSMPGTMPT